MLRGNAAVDFEVFSGLCYNEFCLMCGFLRKPCVACPRSGRAHTSFGFRIKIIYGAGKEGFDSILRV